MVAYIRRLSKPFSWYWLSGFLSDFGDGIRLAAFPLLAAQLTRSPTAVAAVTAVQQLPWLLMGAGIGVIVDRSDSRLLMVIVDSARAVIVSGVAVAIFAHHAGLGLIYLAAFITGTGSALRGTAAIICVPRLVEPADLEWANARVVTGQIVGNELAGPAAGGWLFGLAAVLPFAINTGTLGIGVLLLLTLPSVFQPVSQKPAGQDQVSPLVAIGRDLREGVRWLWRHSEMRNVTIASAVVCAMDAAWFAVLVLYVIQILHQRASAYGLLLVVGALGGIAIGAAGARVLRRLGSWPTLLTAGLAMAFSQAGLGLTGNVVVAAVMLFTSSGAFALFNITAVTMRQRQVPAGMLGRVSGLYLTVSRSAEVVGAMAGGALASSAGIRAPMLFGAIPIAAVMILFSWQHWSRRDPTSV
ncbi:MFS transporter [Actinomadura sp. DC4]|uniref:MFS transporter n=1 Tax=Actinomadura sp. DC4 TaxID=3055069 RepID=UPI0025AF0C8E|nr:MFS transporter [Actinomadura sp. DC4]MDN3358496.1 MFS transporter [Actinomadura sp. DC4]